MNPSDGFFQCYRKGPDILFLGMKIPHKFDSPMERKNPAQEHLSKKIATLFLLDDKIFSFCLDENKIYKITKI